MRRFPFIAALILALPGCAAAPAYLERPADPSATAPPVAYRPVAGDVKAYAPAGPKGWEDLNRRVAPPS